MSPRAIGAASLSVLLSALLGAAGCAAPKYRVDREWVKNDLIRGTSPYDEALSKQNPLELEPLRLLVKEEIRERSDPWGAVGSRDSIPCLASLSNDELDRLLARVEGWRLQRAKEIALETFYRAGHNLPIEWSTCSARCACGGVSVILIELQALAGGEKYPMVSEPVAIDWIRARKAAVAEEQIVGARLRTCRADAVPRVCKLVSGGR